MNNRSLQDIRLHWEREGGRFQGQGFTVHGEERAAGHQIIRGREDRMVPDYTRLQRRLPETRLQDTKLHVEKRVVGLIDYTGKRGLLDTRLHWGREAPEYQITLAKRGLTGNRLNREERAAGHRLHGEGRPEKGQGGLENR
jgi:hypothetical protein